MYYFVNSHLSYSLLRNLKIHFLSLSSHFEKIWSIVHKEQTKYVFELMKGNTFDRPS